MTEKQEGYEVDEAVRYRPNQPDQEELALTNGMAAFSWLTSIGTVNDVRLLEMYWEILNSVAISKRELTEPQRQIRNRVALEMLRRVDNQRLDAMALPPSVYQTWCKITRQEKPGNWKIDCGNACGVQDPYGWVPEAGCPVHDTEDAQTETPLTAEAEQALARDIYKLAHEHFLGCTFGGASTKPSKPDLENDWAPEPGPFGELDEDNEPMTACPLCKVKVAPRIFCECCGETWAPGENK